MALNVALHESVLFDPLQLYSIAIICLCHCCVTVTESSETSSQCTSSDSVTGLSAVTIPTPPSIVMDAYNNNNNDDNEPSFLCSSTPPSSIASPSIFQKDEDLQPQGTKFITAVSIGLSSSLSCHSADPVSRGSGPDIV